MYHKTCIIIQNLIVCTSLNTVYYNTSLVIQILSCVSAFATTYWLSLWLFHKTCRNVFFYDFRLRLVVVKSSLCGGTKIDQFTRAAHMSDKFIYTALVLFEQLHCIDWIMFCYIPSLTKTCLVASLNFGPGEK